MPRCVHRRYHYRLCCGAPRRGPLASKPARQRLCLCCASVGCNHTEVHGCWHTMRSLRRLEYLKSNWLQNHASTLSNSVPEFTSHHDHHNTHSSHSINASIHQYENDSVPAFTNMKMTACQHSPVWKCLCVLDGSHRLSSKRCTISTASPHSLPRPRLLCAVSGYIPCHPSLHCRHGAHGLLRWQAASNGATSICPRLLCSAARAVHNTHIHLCLTSPPTAHMASLLAKQLRLRSTHISHGSVDAVA
jgi:hypothetical protein